MDNAVGTPADNSTWLSGMSMKGDKEQEIVMEQKAKDVMSSKLDSDNDANSGKFRSPLAGIWVSGMPAPKNEPSPSSTEYYCGLEADERRNQNQKADDSEVEVSVRKSRITSIGYWQSRNLPKGLPSRSFVAGTFCGASRQDENDNG